MLEKIKQKPQSKKSCGKRKDKKYEQIENDLQKLRMFAFHWSQIKNCNYKAMQEMEKNMIELRFSRTNKNALESSGNRKMKNYKPIAMLNCIPNWIEIEQETYIYI